MPLKIDYEKCCWKDGRCISCGCGSDCVGCVEACPSGALKRSKILEYSAENCTDCGLCIQACKYDALSLI
ncbi:MAG: 4Fe-4S binding protein [Candidatus Omnitrophica bacterium]|nr:4Fe-4S binding protein [Candidatus Omnitrophota bacterium]MBU2044021.1 4Fe-4S binding protein [Candidatus Omnitrophota bacterium]MBU2473931.1 4Fe-4S binding protein [Candidatus Omnitrophota bacterium]